MQRVQSRPRVALAVALLMLPAVSIAHHSRAEFSGDVVEIEGKIAGTIWANPHPYVVVSAVDANGNSTEWRIEMYSNLFGTERIGVDGDKFVEGASLRAAGLKSTRRDGYLLGYNLLFDDGTEAVISRLSSPRWQADQVLQDEGPDAEYQAVHSQALANTTGIFRVWSPVYESVRVDLPLTESALAARGAWDELDNFLTRCEQPGMPHTMKTPQEYELIDEGSTIRIRAQYFDTERTVHMQERDDLNDQPASHLGYSVGRWEGTALVIETTKIDWPYFDTIGTPQSHAVHVTERYTPSADYSRLQVLFTIRDPATFNGPATIEREWLALGRTIQKYDCQVF
ncbi:MAG: DUF6152 family protein [Gammaproteobacteria bacterium]|nr:DUF6152 family protein [Gammaproteobacteria bacterium]